MTPINYIIYISFKNIEKLFDNTFYSINYAFICVKFYVRTLRHLLAILDTATKRFEYDEQD